LFEIRFISLDPIISIRFPPSNDTADEGESGVNVLVQPRGMFGLGYIRQLVLLDGLRGTLGNARSTRSRGVRNVRETVEGLLSMAIRVEMCPKR
jgi:hypothetical protein